LGVENHDALGWRSGLAAQVGRVAGYRTVSSTPTPTESGLSCPRTTLASTPSKPSRFPPELTGPLLLPVNACGAVRMLHLPPVPSRKATMTVDAHPHDAVTSNITGRQVRGISEIAAVPISSLASGISPRSNGESKAHIAQLAEVESALPPLLVDRRTMQVIDGMHRLRAAMLQGRQTIEVTFFEGTAADAFLRAVEANVRHGLPLSFADRKAAAARIISSHPHLSDRALAESTGLSAKLIARIRRSTESVPRLNARVGKDGRTRP
jgi:hypothetical protein